jgi:hypothetical protein
MNCTEPNCGRRRYQFFVVWFSSNWSQDSRIAENFGGASRDGADRNLGGRAGEVPLRRGATSPDARDRSLRSPGGTGPTTAHRDGGVVFPLACSVSYCFSQRSNSFTAERKLMPFRFSSDSFTLFLYYAQGEGVVTREKNSRRGDPPTAKWQGYSRWEL